MATPQTPSGLPFWNVNVPDHLQTEECPPYLQYALSNPKDQEILATPDRNYHRQTWPEVCQIIKDNRLDLFQRVPSDLRRYREYNAKTVEQWGSVMEFVVKERLGWEEVGRWSSGGSRFQAFLRAQ